MKTPLEIAIETKMRISAINDKVQRKTEETQKIILRTKRKIFEMRSRDLGIKVNFN